MSKKPPNKKEADKRAHNSSLSEETKPKKVRKTISYPVEDGIAISKQLSKILSHKSETTRKCSRNNNEPRICPNGTPMPSLADLEKMFEDSEDEDVNKTTTTAVKENKETIPSAQAKMFAARILESLSNISYPAELLNILPPPRIVKQKKPKKSGIPYIIGCKERDQVIRKPKTNWAQGDDNYGVDINAAGPEDLETPKKRQKRSKRVNLSKSIFNAQSDEIARVLTTNDYSSDNSSDSNKTISYYDDKNNNLPYSNNNVSSPNNNLPSSNNNLSSPDNDLSNSNNNLPSPNLPSPNNNSSSPNGRSFSPLPSTSKDSETFLKNDQRFSECIINNDNSDDSDLEIIDPPSETIVIGEPIKSTPSVPMPKQENIGNDDVQIIEVQTPNTQEDIIDLDDFYGPIKLQEQPYNGEIIDVDDVIAENNAFIEKYRHTNKSNTITLVEPIQTQTSNKQNNTLNSTLNVQDTRSDVQNTPVNPIIPGGTSDITDRLPASTNCEKGTNKIPNTTGLYSGYDTMKMFSQVVSNFFNRWNKSKGASNLSNPPSTTPPPNPIYGGLGSITVHYKGRKPFRILGRWSDGRSPTKPLTFTRAQKPPSVGQQKSHPIMANLVVNPMTQKTCLNGNNVVAPQSSNSKNAELFGDCPICMDKIGKTSIASTLCGHVFCLGCIKAAITVNGKKCPTCRKTLRGVGYHPLFI